MIVDELLPALYKDYNISRDPDQHGIGGASSGGIAAFTVAWERPSEFHKVFTIVGSFVDFAAPAAAALMPTKLLASDKKPIRIFLQDGRNDNRGQGRGGNYDEHAIGFIKTIAWSMRSRKRATK